MVGSIWVRATAFKVSIFFGWQIGFYMRQKLVVNWYAIHYRTLMDNVCCKKNLCANSFMRHFDLLSTHFM